MLNRFITEPNTSSVLIYWLFTMQNKKERKKVREVGILKKDPNTIKEQIDKLEMMSMSLGPNNLANLQRLFREFIAIFKI